MLDSIPTSERSVYGFVPAKPVTKRIQRQQRYLADGGYPKKFSFERNNRKEWKTTNGYTLKENSRKECKIAKTENRSAKLSARCQSEQQQKN
jgi:L-fucose isomerase-like protein